MIRRHIITARTALVIMARSFLAYLFKPHLNDVPGTRVPLSAPVIVLCLFALSLMATAIFGALALPLLMITEAAPGEQLQQVMSQPIGSVLLAVIVLGPLIEEIMFRGWLSGTWRAFFGSALFIALFFGGAPLIVRTVDAPAYVVQLGLAVLGLASFRLLSPIDAGKRAPYFEKAFPYLFWGQGLVFGLLHFKNVAASSSVVATLATLPLVLCAWLWGYARIVIGLQGAIFLHAAYNVPAVLGMFAMMLVH